MSAAARIAALAVLLPLGGCGAVGGWTHPAAGPTKLVAANETVDPPVVVPPSPIITAPTQLKAVESHPVASLPEIDAPSARRAAKQKPVYINAVAVYDFVPGTVYQVFASPDYVTTVELKPGEKLNTLVGGDTSRWVIGDTSTGDGATARAIVMVKPVRDGLRTNLVITTDQHLYFLDLSSRDGNQYQNAVAWNYPQDDFRDQFRKTAVEAQKASETEISGLRLESLNYDYDVAVDSGDRPLWLPHEVFDDGQKTYINFPADLGTTEAPPLFVLAADGTADLVNFRVKGHFYIVDRLFDEAQLRVGKGPQTVVTIRRKTPRPTAG